MTKTVVLFTALITGMSGFAETHSGTSNGGFDRPVAAEYKTFSDSDAVTSIIRTLNEFGYKRLNFGGPPNAYQSKQGFSCTNSPIRSAWVKKNNFYKE